MWGAMRGEQRQGNSAEHPSPHLNSCCITLGSILAWRENTELVKIIFPQGESSSQPQRALGSGSSGHSALGTGTGQTAARLPGTAPTGRPESQVSRGRGRVHAMPVCRLEGVNEQMGVRTNASSCIAFPQAPVLPRSKRIHPPFVQIFTPLG